jgi:hypothetical protein
MILCIDGSLAKTVCIGQTADLNGMRYVRPLSGDPPKGEEVGSVGPAAPELSPCPFCETPDRVVTCPDCRGNRADQDDEICLKCNGAGLVVVAPAPSALSLEEARKLIDAYGALSVQAFMGRKSFEGQSFGDLSDELNEAYARLLSHLTGSTPKENPNV